MLFQYVANRAMMNADVVNPSAQKEWPLARSIAAFVVSAVWRTPDFQTVNRNHGAIVKARIASGATSRFQETRCRNNGLSSRGNMTGTISVRNPPATPRTNAAVFSWPRQTKKAVAIAPEARNVRTWSTEPARMKTGLKNRSAGAIHAARGPNMSRASGTRNSSASSEPTSPMSSAVHSGDGPNQWMIRLVATYRG